ncbi:MAG: ribosome maturation factor RimM [Bryobacteraceae bacterium]
MARLLRARGIRGEIAADGMGTRFSRFDELQQCKLYGPDGREKPVEIESVWEYRSNPVFKFRGIDTMTAAEELQGYELRIPIEERAPVPEGEYFHSDLIACQVVEKDGAVLGLVTKWEDFGGTGILVVKGEKELMIPFAKKFLVEIDVAAKRIVVDLPEGLKEL